MIKVICDKFTATVVAKGNTEDTFYESIGLILEGFRVIRSLDPTLYESAKSDIFVAIVNGVLDEWTDLAKRQMGHEVHIDLSALREQLQDEEGDN